MGFDIQDTTYSGTAQQRFITAAITGADTVNGGHVYIKDNIKKKYTIPRYELGSIIQERVPTPTSSKGTQTIDAKVLDPQDYMIYFEFNPRDFEDHWYAEQLSPTLLTRGLPSTIESVVTMEAMKVHMKYFNSAIWNGDMSLASSNELSRFDGIITKAKADASVIDVASPTTLSKTNIVTEFEKGYQVIPAALKFDTSMKYYVSYKTLDLYRQYQQEQTYKGVDVTSAGVYRYNGREVVGIADFPDDTYVIAKGMPNTESNLWVGVNSFSDEGLQLARLQANSELYFIKGLMKADTQIAWGKEFILYSA